VKGSFKTLWCEKHRCPASEYQQRVFGLCLHRHAVLLAPLITRLSPSFFEEVMGFIREAGTARTRDELVTEVNRFYGRNVRDKNWFRNTFALRVSAARFLSLSHDVFSAK